MLNAGIQIQLAEFGARVGAAMRSAAALALMSAFVTAVAGIAAAQEADAPER